MPVTILGITIGGYEAAFLQLGAGIGIATVIFMVELDRLIAWLKVRLGP